MTFAVLRALHAIIGEALDDIQTIYAAAPIDLDSDVKTDIDTDPDSPSSETFPIPPPTRHHHYPRPPTPPLLSFSPPTDPNIASRAQTRAEDRKCAGSDSTPRKTHGLDFPALDDPGDSQAPAELLTAHPDVSNAISRIVSAAGHMAAVVRSPFLMLCDASMGYHLPSCLRFLEAAHIPELLREAGKEGVHAGEISTRIGVESVKTSHILRLLATHHLLRELRPDVFALNRISSLLDSGKSFNELQANPENKYDGAGGKAAFVALNTDELFKASAYLTDFLLPNCVPDDQTIGKTLLPLSPPSSTTATLGSSSPQISSNLDPVFFNLSSMLPFSTTSKASSNAPSVSEASEPPRRSLEDDPLSTAQTSQAPAQRQTQPHPLAPAPVIRRLLSRPKLNIGKASRGGSPSPGGDKSPRSPSVPRKSSRSPIVPNRSPREPSALNKSTREPFTPNESPREPIVPDRSPHEPSTGFKSPVLQGKSPGKSPKGSGGSGMWLSRRVEPARVESSSVSTGGDGGASVMSTTGSASGVHKGRYDETITKAKNKHEEQTPPPLTAFSLSQRTGSSYWAWLEAPGNEARLRRFGRAMGGSEAWEGEKGEGLGAYPFPYLPPGALVVDVGGGIGSSTMRLAGLFPELRFVVQDREAVCRIGEEAWRARCPEMLEEGRVRFQVHDFFTPQPVHSASVFLVRVICHDWPDTLARRMLLQLRRAAKEGEEGQGGTYLVIGDHVLPYAVAGGGGGEGEKDRDEGGDVDVDEELEGIEGASDVQTLRGARWPLLANLGKASANAYWMDLTMQVTFNGQERTLPELVALAASAGWRIVRVSGTEGSLFGHIIAVPGPIPRAASERKAEDHEAGEDVLDDADGGEVAKEMQEGGVERMMMTRASTPALDMFGSPPELPYEYGPVVRKEGKKGMWVRWMRGRTAGKEGKERIGLERVEERGSGEFGQRGEGSAVVVREREAQGQREGRGLFRKVSQLFGEGGS